jgi:penicillin-binding protein 2
VYAPGSTFKPLVAIAALENGRADGATAYGCPGFFQIGNAVFRCWRRSGHGTLQMQGALEQSCNAYFCQLGLQCGYERIYHMAEAVGFGLRTGIELPGEASGLVPNDAWKRATQGDGWRSGDTCNVSIGQGPILATPLQMAVFTAAIANKGTVYRPRLVLGIGDQAGDGAAHGGGAGEGRPRASLRRGVVANRMGWSAETMRVVRQGMYDVVHAETGTGKRARIGGVEMAGKTGSAEYGPDAARKKYAWMIAFAPFATPRYAIAMVIEDGESGGKTTAPRIRYVMQGVFRIEQGHSLPM